jgi:hypothetical protein
MLLLDLLHEALVAKARDGDEPNRYMKAMTIRAEGPKCVNTSVV